MMPCISLVYSSVCTRLKCLYIPELEVVVAVAAAVVRVGISPLVGPELVERTILLHDTKIAHVIIDTSGGSRI